EGANGDGLLPTDKEIVCVDTALGGIHGEIEVNDLVIAGVGKAIAHPTLHLPHALAHERVALLNNAIDPGDSVWRSCAVRRLREVGSDTIGEGRGRSRDHIAIRVHLLRNELEVLVQRVVVDIPARANGTVGSAVEVSRATIRNTPDRAGSQEIARENV